MRVRYTARAISDLDRIFSYINERSPKNAIEIKRRIERLASGLADFPLAGREAGFRNVRVLVAGRYPYLIFYRVVAEDVHIIHVRHAARRPWTG